MAARRRCLGCGHTYPSDVHACPKCGSHAGEVEVAPVVSKTKRGGQTRRERSLRDSRKA